MKKLMKKLAAIALAGAMALSCCAMAFATGDDTEPPVTDEYTEGESSGTGTNESNRLAHPIRVVMPTESETTFNMILDPHELIKSTEAARYSDATFDYGTKLFFQTSPNNYSGNSPSLMVENKGDCDVSLGVELSVDKANSTFNFVNDSALLVDTPDLDAEIEDQLDAQMFLALVSGETVKALGRPEPDKVISGEVESGDEDVVDTSSVIFAYDADATAAQKAVFANAIDGKTVTVAYTTVGNFVVTVDAALTDYTTVLEPSAAELADTSEVEPANGDTVAVTFKKGTDVIGVLSFTLEDMTDLTDESSTITLAAADGTPAEATITDVSAKATESNPEFPMVAEAAFEFDADATDTVKSAFADAMSGKSFLIEFADDTVPFTVTAPSVTGYTITQTPATAVAATRELSFAVATTDSTPVAVGTLTVTLEADIDAYIEDDAPAATVSLTFKSDDGQSAEFKTSLPMTEGAYEDKWMPDKNHYERIPVETVTEFEKVVFYLTGDINKTAKWDNNGSDVKITVTWELKEFDPTYGEQGGTEGPSGGGSVATNKAPKVSVVTPATSTASGGDRTATIKYTAGTGTYADYAPTSATYIRSGASATTTLTITWDGTTGTFSTTSAVVGGSEHKVIFTSAADATKTYEVSLNVSDFYTGT